MPGVPLTTDEALARVRTLFEEIAEDDDRTTRPAFAIRIHDIDIIGRKKYASDSWMFAALVWHNTSVKWGPRRA